MQERDMLVRSKLSPKAVKAWLVSGFGLGRLIGNLSETLCFLYVPG